jgi:hypothetical protein
LSNPLPIGVDGYGRPVQTDREISANVAQVFESATGKEVLRYLRSITIEMVNGPNVTNEELRHMEGQRYLVGLIERRIQSAHRNKK